MRASLAWSWCLLLPALAGPLRAAEQTPASQAAVIAEIKQELAVLFDAAPDGFATFKLDHEGLNDPDKTVYIVTPRPNLHTEAQYVTVMKETGQHRFSAYYQGDQAVAQVT